MSNYLFAFTFTPVQAFIAEARRGQDLFTGSRILSDMARAVFKALQTAGSTPIYPPSAGDDDDIPNKLMFEIPAGRDINQLGKDSIDALHARWQQFVDQAYQIASRFGSESNNSLDNVKPDKQWHDIWKRQTKAARYWECFWAAVPLDTMHYKTSVDEVNRYLDGAKRARAFVQSPEAGMKDTLSGSRSALYTDVYQGDAKRYWTEVYTHSPKPNVVNPAKLRPNGRERLDGIGCVKRFGIDDAKLPNIPSVSTVASADYLTELLKKSKTDLNFRLNQYCWAIADLPDKPIFRVRNGTQPFWPYDGDLLYEETLTKNRLCEDYALDKDKLTAWHIRALTEALEALYQLMDNKKPCPYFAVLRMDGDSMGEAVSKCTTAKEHREFSKKISDFAGKVEKILQNFHGSKIYAGGDDVLALLPLSTCVSAAQALAEKFYEITGCRMSAGIAIAHHLSPLDVVLRESVNAEKAAKGIIGKSALAIHASKRSGALIQVTAKWETLKVCKFDQFPAAFGDLSSSSLNAVYAEACLSSKAAYDIRTMAEQFIDLGLQDVGFSDHRTRTAAFKSQLRLELQRHVMGKSADERRSRSETLFAALSQWTDQLEAHPKQAVMLADWLILARFIGKRGAE